MTESMVLNWVEWIITGIEILAVIVIVVAVVFATARYVQKKLFRRESESLYEIYRKRLAQAILVGLEILIAADVIRTVALDRTFQAIVVLGLLVLVRIVLSWSLLVEIEHRWPWQSRPGDNLEEKD